MTATRPPLFDSAAQARAQARARRMDGDRFLETAATEGLADRLAPVTRRFQHGLFVIRADEAVPDAVLPFAVQWQRADFDDREVLQAPDEAFDLAVSLFSLQAINDLPGALVQVRRKLKPDGLFVAALFGGGTLGELRDAFARAESLTRGGISPRVSPFADVRDAGGLLQRAGFALPVADVERLTVRYGNIFALVRDLRAHGLTNVLSERSRGNLRRDTLAALIAEYSAHHADADGRLRARFETIYLTGWAPHESQQQPLRPGSAKIRLADALGAREEIISENHPGLSER